MIQTLLADAIARAVADAQAAGAVPHFEMPPVELSRPKVPEHGDWSSQIALAAAKRAGMKPRDLANEIAGRMAEMKEIAAVEVAGPGFLNFRLSHATLTGIVGEVQEAGANWGRSRTEPAERVQVEFVSANPTGPLHLGHGRWAVVGDAIATLLEATGHRVEREFYINDFGNQMQLFGESLRARYLQENGRDADVPEGGYQGAYMRELAQELLRERGAELADAGADVFREIGRDHMLTHQRAVLERIGVRFDVWFSETELHRAGDVTHGIEQVKQHGHVYEADGAVWLRTTDFGDDKDRVIVRESGEPTYFAADIAYYLSKKSRGFDRLIYLWGADHHGYVARVRAAIQCLGDDPGTVEFLIGQLVNLKRSGQPVRMSKRTGELVTFEELVDEVGSDATRYTLLRQLSIDTPLDFDIDLVVQRSQDNPVFYVQYAHARICSIIGYARDQGVESAPVANVDLERLSHPSELELVRKIGALPDVVATAGRMRAPHRLTNFAEELAGLFHAFYRDCRVVTDDGSLTQARLHLSISTKITLANVLAFLGVTAPERM
ncbi:MAG: arginine--tRNA ligase [Actinobacteria bacterium]|nr:arginine--tRNA ligase [Actinomycetota bacterium]